MALAALLAAAALASVVPHATQATVITAFPGTWCDAAKKLRYDYSTTTFNWVDITDQLYWWEPSIDEVVTGADPLGFNFRFFGTNYNAMVASDNGVMTLDTLSGMPASNYVGQLMPNAGSPNAVVAALWYDWDPSGGKMASMNMGGYYLFEWDGLQKSAQAPGTIAASYPGHSFEIKLIDADDSIEIHVKRSLGSVGAAWNGYARILGIESAYDAANSWQGGIYRQMTTDLANYAVRFVPVLDAAPLAAADTYSATQGSVLSVSGGTQPGGAAGGTLFYIATNGVLANDRDELPCATKTAQLVTGIPAGQGTLTLAANGGFTYDPGSFCGTTSFTYRVLDPAGSAGGTAFQSGTATVTLNVACLPNQAPTAVCTVTTPAPYAAGQAIAFSGATSSDPDGTVAAYEWAFPSGTPAASTSPTPSPSWGAGGTYTATLRVRDDLGVWSSTVNCPSVTIPGPTANQPPTASNALYQVAMGTTFNSGASPQGGLSNFASDPENAPLTFTACPPGLAGLSVAPDGSFTYVAGNSPTTVTFQYRVSDGSSSSACATVTLQVLANVRPTARFSIAPSPATVGQQVGFSDASTDPDAGDGIAAWHWSFGDGATALGRNPAHVYGAAGSYNVCLVVDDTKGASSVAWCATVTVTDVQPGQPSSGAAEGDQPQADDAPPEPQDDGPPPALHVTIEGPANAAPGSSVPLVAHSDGSPATTYAWQVLYGDAHVAGDGASATLQLPVGPSQPVYVAVTATDGAATGLAGLTVSTSPAGGPTPRIDAPATATAGQDVRLDASGSQGDGPLTYRWTQVGGPAATLLAGDSATPTLRLGATAGQVTVLLAVGDAGGSATALHVLDVQPGPDDGPAGGADAGFVSRGTGLTVRFVPQRAAPSYTWAFGDGETATSVGAVSHTYAKSGTFTVQMTADGATSTGDATASAPLGHSVSDLDGAGTGGPGGLPAWLPYAAAGFLAAFLLVGAFLVLRRRAS